MRHLATFADIRTAKAVSDYLQNQQIDNEISSDEQGWCLFIADESQLDRAQQELEQFVNNPYDQKYLDASWIRSQSADIYTKVSKSNNSLFKQIWLETGIVTRIVSLTVLVIFALQIVGFHPWIYHYLGFPISLAAIDISQLHQLVTPAFMHGSLVHLLFNLFWWIWLGGKLEVEKGSGLLINLFLISALGAHLCQYSMVSGSFLGLSGVVYGLLGYAWVAGKLNKLKLQIPNGIFIMMLLWLVVGFAEVLAIPMANWAHLGGMIAGMVWARFEKPTRSN
ncbi:rhomboid family protein [Catenovulum agarivorans DS-2]|uniref:Rhomboid family protein n=1 Tax=Catenovulum agarivorans DS-2 TaxID=1328313 RepID=W7QM60_9ALTE|nr:rhomboid family intramembrane serine protease GlpG [Catenovulum agarivorans]EWH10037.1 rhomboid family protein [Catenovulum agarivorans DS-2]